jgi:hypothetical protein
MDTETLRKRAMQQQAADHAEIERLEAECEKLRGERDAYKNACVVVLGVSEPHEVGPALASIRAALKKCGEALGKIAAIERGVMDCTQNGGEIYVSDLEDALLDIGKHARAALAADTPRGADEMTCPDCKGVGMLCDYCDCATCFGVGKVPAPQEGTGKPTARDLIGQGRDAKGNPIDARRAAGEVFEAGVEDRTRATGEPEPPEHLKPYLATEPPTLSAEEQEHADRLAVEIGRDQKGEGDNG